MWEEKDTHGKQTLASTNLRSNHDQAVNQTTREKDCAFFVDKGGWQTMGTTHYKILASKDEFWGLGLHNVQS